MSARIRLSRRRTLGGWNVYRGGVLIGWVVRHPVDRRWRAYVASGQCGHPVGWEYATRRDAVAEVEIQCVL
jgi:hypothetical protein